MRSKCEYFARIAAGVIPGTHPPGAGAIGMERRRLELPTSSLQSCEPPPQDPADTGVYDSRFATTSYTPSGSASYGPHAADAPNDPDLAAMIAAWPDLPGPVRAGINAMVRAAIGG